jgi:hypothetical protein
LTAQAARSAAFEGLLYITFTSAHVLDFALNWVDHMVLLDNRNFLVGAEPALDRLGREAVCAANLLTPPPLLDGHAATSRCPANLPNP